MKFRVERDVLAEAVAWAARSLPARPPVPVLAGLLLDASGRPAGAVELRLRGLRPGRGRRRRRRAGRGPGHRPAAGRHLPQPAASPVEVTHRRRQGGRDLRRRSRFTLLTLPVEDYPALPEMPGASGSLRGDVFAAAVAQVAVAAGRDDTLPVLTGVRVEIEGETHHAGRHRPLPARGARAGLDAGAVRAVRDRAGAGPHPGRHREGAGRRRQGHARAGRRRPAARAWSASRAAAGAPRPGCSTASSRSTSRCCPASRPAWRPSRPPALVEAVHRVALVAERNTPVRLSLRRRRADPRGRHRRRGAGVGVAGRGPRRRRHLDRVQPGLPARRPRRRRRARTPSCASPRPTKPAVLTGKDDAGRHGRRRLPLPADAGAAVRLSRPSGHGQRQARGSRSDRSREGAATHGDRTRRAGPDGRQHARAAAPRRAHRRRLRPQPRHQRLRRRSTRWSSSCRRRGWSG